MFNAINTKLLLVIIAALLGIAGSIEYQNARIAQREAQEAKAKAEEAKASAEMQNAVKHQYTWDGAAAANTIKNYRPK